MLTHAGSGHPGGSLSVIDILTVLYFNRMTYDPKRPTWEDRDRIVLSKGHCVPAQYFCMAKAGYFPESQLLTLRKLGSPLQGHPDRMALPGSEAARALASTACSATAKCRKARCGRASCPGPSWGRPIIT